MLTGEQSNTSLIFGEESILKVFRRPSPGINPDLEVNRALARLGSTHIAQPLGWAESTLGGAPVVLGILSGYLRAATDGWSLAATSVRDLYASETAIAADAGGDFAGEAYRLGEATAEVHRDLVAAPSAPRNCPRMRSAGWPTTCSTGWMRPSPPCPSWASTPTCSARPSPTWPSWTGRWPCSGSTATTTWARCCAPRPGGWCSTSRASPRSRWRCAGRRASALRDVAGMLRSFDYAARHQLLAHRDEDWLHAAAVDWVRRNQDAFCAGYAAAGGTDPGTHAVLLRALVLDKAVYEVMYEARHRPGWLAIPLGSIADA